MGYKKFKIHHHVDLWKSKNAKDKAKNFGVQVSKSWYWYDTWLNEVKAHCAENSIKYGKNT